MAARKRKYTPKTDGPGRGRQVADPIGGHKTLGFLTKCNPPELALADAVRDHYGCTRGELVRRLIRDRAVQLGLTPTT